MAESHTITGTLAAFRSVSRPAVAIARGHMSVFYPSLIILDIYVCAWALMIALGHGDMPIIKVMAIVCFVVVPMLFVYALIRFMTVSIIVTRNKILIRRGWPHSGVHTIARGDVSAAHAGFSYFGKIIGAGALTITTQDGTHYRVKDITAPDAMAARLNATVKRAKNKDNQPLVLSKAA